MSGINWHTFFFLWFALSAGGFAVAVVLSGNIVRMALYLILSLGSTAGLFFLAGADFLGAMQLMIYVGGTLVLLVFGVMLTAQGPFVHMRTSGGDWILASLVSGGLLAVLMPAAFSVPSWNEADWGAGHAVAETTSAPFRTIADSQTAAESASADDATGDVTPAGPPLARPTATRLGMSLVGVRVDKLDDQPQRLKAGLSGYLLPFEVVSVHLLVVLVGAAYLARAKRRQGGT